MCRRSNLVLFCSQQLHWERLTVRSDQKRQNRLWSLRLRRSSSPVCTCVSEGSDWMTNRDRLTIGCRLRRFAAHLHKVQSLPTLIARVAPVARIASRRSRRSDRVAPVAGRPGRSLSPVYIENEWQLIAAVAPVSFGLNAQLDHLNSTFKVGPYLTCAWAQRCRLLGIQRLFLQRRK